jgi:hypothetical protein
MNHQPLLLLLPPSETAPEPIQRQDGHNKNDCERNGARRWLETFRKDHPHLGIIVIEDALSSNAPHIRDLRATKAHFILGVKEADHAYLFEQFYQRLEAGQVEEVEEADPHTKTTHSYLFVNGLTLNESNQEVKVNFLQYAELDENGEVKRKWTWVVEVELTRANVRMVMRGGRARWRVENETFNTLSEPGVPLRAQLRSWLQEPVRGAGVADDGGVPDRSGAAALQRPVREGTEEGGAEVRLVGSDPAFILLFQSGIDAGYLRGHRVRLRTTVDSGTDRADSSRNANAGHFVAGITGQERRE